MSNLIEKNKDHIDILRAKRAKAFAAFDIYKDNVNYGLIEETEERHNQIVVWYELCLDLEPSAINNVPEEIKKYIN